MKNTIYEIIENIFWNIRAFFLQPIIPIKTKEWVISNGCSYNGESTNGKYTYYWYGSIKKGYQVKVKKIKK